MPEITEHARSRCFWHSSRTVIVIKSVKHLEASPRGRCYSCNIATTLSFRSFDYTQAQSQAHSRLLSPCTARVQHAMHAMKSRLRRTLPPAFQYSPLKYSFDFQKAPANEPKVDQDLHFPSPPSSTTSITPSSAAMAPLDAPEGVTRPVVFFDIQIGDQNAGRIKMGESKRCRRCQARALLQWMSCRPSSFESLLHQEQS